MNSEREQPKHSAKFLRQRKFLLVMPVLVLPFLVFLLWTLGLVGEVKAESKTAAIQQGFNMTLPSAAPAKDSAWNKMKYYEQADRDSMRLRTLLKNDPYRKLELDVLSADTDADISLSPLEKKDKQRRRAVYDPYPSDKQTDYNEKRVQQKLAALQEQLDVADKEEKKPKAVKEINPRSVLEPAAINPDVAKLEAMMQSMQEGTGENAELKQLNEMLDKIVDIQHPQRMHDKIREQSEKNKRQVFPVEQPLEDIISALEPRKDFRELLAEYKKDSLPQSMRARAEGNAFYSLDEPVFILKAQNAIPAVVHEDQTLVSGATIKLRLMEDVFIAGVLIPKDHFVYGLATLNGERLEVAVSSIEYRNHILPVSLTVYDKRDGQPGINIPGAITRDVAKRFAAQSVQGLGTISTLDPSFGAQMATAGLQAAQNLIGKSARLVKGTVPAGYAVLLKDDNQKDK